MKTAWIKAGASYREVEVLAEIPIPKTIAVRWRFATGDCKDEHITSKGELLEARPMSEFTKTRAENRVERKLAAEKKRNWLLSGLSDEWKSLGEVAKTLGQWPDCSLWAMLNQLDECEMMKEQIRDTIRTRTMVRRRATV